MVKGKGKTMVTRKGKRPLIPKGTPLPGRPGFKLESSHLTIKEADKATDELLEKPGVETVLTVRVPKQIALYQKSRRVRITPKTPRLRR